MCGKNGLIGWSARAQADTRLHALAPTGVGHAYYRDAANGRMGRKHILDLGRIDILAARNDHVLGPIDDIIEAFLVAARDISRAVPDIFDDLLCKLGLRPIAGRDRGWPE